MTPSRALPVLPPPAASGRWVPAELYVREGEALLCTLCPHACRLEEGQAGACHVRRAVAGRMETATFATAVAHLDAIERKPLYHFRPGSRVLTLAAPGCSFSCHYCANWRLSQFGRVEGATGDARPVDPEAIVEQAAQAGAAVGLSYSEPSLAPELTLALSAAARPRGVPVLWKTNGFLTPVALARLAPALAAVNLDLKAPDERKHRALTGAPLAPVLETARALIAAGTWVEVSTPILPGFNDDPVSLGRTAELVAGLGSSVPWHLLRFTPDFRMRRQAPTAPATLARAAARGRAAGLRFVYVERALGAEGRRTDCPACGEAVVTRGIWSCDSVRLDEGKCRHCGAVVPGRW